MKTKLLEIEKYSKIISEIERFIKSEKEKPTTIKGKVIGVDLSNNIITVELLLNNYPNLSKGSLILIRENSILSIDIKAIVNENYNFNLKIEIRNNPLQFENKEVIIDTSKTNVILKRLENIIKNIGKGEISLENRKMFDILIGENKSEYDLKKVSFVSEELNESQKEAVIKSICVDDFHLIIGPPGTGKTYVIEELIYQFSKRKQKLLITAWTNLAIDNIIKRLLKKKSVDIVRIGSINKIDPEVREYSIDERMKKHEDWKEVEDYQRDIHDFNNAIPLVRDKINLKKIEIERIQNNIKIFNKELDNFFNEQQKYKLIKSQKFDYRNLVNIFKINSKLNKLNKKSEDYLSLSEDILQMRDLQIKIPKVSEISRFKKSIRGLKFSILKRKVFSFFSNENKKEFERLKNKYEKKKKKLNEILELQKKYNYLKNKCNLQTIRLYQGELGHPEEDLLDSEFKAYKILETEYLPVFKEQEMFNTEKEMFQIDQEVFHIYLMSLKRRIDLLNGRIQKLRVEKDIAEGHKNNLEKQRMNLEFSLGSYKRAVERLIKKIRLEIIKNADMVVATAISSCHSFLEEIKFDVMIMEEASQVASFMSLLPLSKCKKFILVGDNKQLQPIGEKNISEEMNLSLFNRLFEMYPDDSTLLTTQYRMHDTIAQIPNEIFYEGKLKTFEKVAKEILNLNVSNPRFLNPKIPAMFIDTSNVEYYEDEVGSSCSNTKEAEYVAYMVSLFIKNKIKNKDIGIITPYVKQKLLIEKHLENLQIRDVEVNTVHRFQGKEKEIIIMSFAKSKKYSFPQYMLKFIEDKTLVNVSITRAKKKLILIGNYKTLCQSELLNRVIDKIGESNRVVL